MSNRLTDLGHQRVSPTYITGHTQRIGAKLPTVCDGSRALSRGKRDQRPSIAPTARLLCMRIDQRGLRAGIQVYLHRPPLAGHGRPSAPPRGLQRHGWYAV